MLSRSRVVGKGRGEVVPGVRALALRCSLEKGTHSRPTKPRARQPSPHIGGRDVSGGGQVTQVIARGLRGVGKGSGGGEWLAERRWGKNGDWRGPQGDCGESQGGW